MWRRKECLVVSLVVLLGLATSSWATPLTWDLQVVQDVAGQIEGSQNSVAVSPVDGKIHVGYSAISKAKLRQAEGTGEPYAIDDSIAPLGQHRWIGTAVGADNTTWVTSCNTWSGGAVNAAYDNGSGFTNEVITTGANVGSAIAVRKSDNQPVVSYGTGANLMFSQRTGTNSWTTPVVVDTGKRFEDSQIQLTSNDVPYIAYRNDWAYDLKLAFPDGTGGWTNETVATNIMNSNNDGSGGTDDDQYSKVLDLAMTSADQAVLAYTDTSGHVNIKLRTGANSYSNFAVTSSGIARSVALAIGEDGLAYVAFNDVTKGDLLLGIGDLSSGSFDVQTVVSNSVDGLNVQRHLDIAMQANGLPVISFFNINSSPAMNLAVAVPEPVSISLLAGGVLVLFRRRKS